MLAMPRRGGREPQRAPGAALVVRIEDVVVGLVRLADPGVGVGRRAVLGAEAADVHLPEVEARLALDDPLRHHLADPAGAGEPVGAEARGDEQPADLGLAEAELVVRREPLGAVDHLRHPDLAHLGHAALRVLDDLGEAVPVLLEQAAVEVARDPVEPARPVGQEGGRAVALVAAHHQAAALLAEVDQQVGVAQRRQMFVAAALAKRLRDDVLVRHRDDRDAHARHAADLGAVHAAGVDDDLGLDVAALGSHAAHAAVGDVDARDGRRGEDRAAALARAVGERVRELGGIEVAVGRQPRRAEHSVGRHQREHLARLVGRDQLEREAERLRPPGLAPQLLHPLLARGEADAAALDPAGIELGLVAEPPVELDRVHHHLRQRDRAAKLAHEAGGVEGRARGQLGALEQDDVLPAQLARGGTRSRSRPPRRRSQRSEPNRAAQPFAARASSSRPAKRGSAAVSLMRSKCFVA